MINAFPEWQIYEMAGGWAAIRVNLVPKDSGLSNVRCGETLNELIRHLKAESQFQTNLPKRLRGVA
ncbi:hypothetical protein ACFLIM_20495 [Nonomuraea sp. M3C6]|uniref:Uncharacterized protein n=1 Tax=Nonomuraea marmarensis TaxID=3351344 RepID=A0ABW7AE17_9ACTN